MRLKDKVGLITGAATGVRGEVMGFGGATAWLFSREGAAVVIADINDEMGELTASQMREDGHKTMFVHLDASQETDWINAIRVAVENFGGLDILVNNAGSGVTKSIEDTSLEEWNTDMAVHATGAFLGTKYAIPEMRKRGGGVIVNMSSMHGIVGGSGRSPAYTSAKAAIRNFTKTAAIAYAKENIRVNSIHPGNSLTPRVLARYPDGTLPDSVTGGQNAPMGRLGKAEEIAQGILFLASDDSSFMTGSELVADGGFLAR